VIQYNKRDLPGVLAVNELEDVFNFRALPSFSAVAVDGEGVFPTLKSVSSLVLQSLSRRFRTHSGSPS